MQKLDIPSPDKNLVVSGYVRIVSSQYTVQCNSASSYQNIELNVLSFIGHRKELSELWEMPKYLYASCTFLSWWLTSDSLAVLQLQPMGVCIGGPAKLWHLMWVMSVASRDRGSQKYNLVPTTAQVVCGPDLAHVPKHWTSKWIFLKNNIPADMKSYGCGFRIFLENLYITPTFRKAFRKLF